MQANRPSVTEAGSSFAQKPSHILAQNNTDLLDYGGLDIINK